MSTLDSGGRTAEGSGGGWAATGAAALGLALGPSTVLVFLFGVFVGPLEREFGWQRPAIMLAMTIVALMIMVLSPIQGWLIDRVGARRLVLWSALPFAAGLVALTRVGPDIRGFYLMYALLPCLAIGLWPMSYLRVVSTWFDRRMGLAFGLANGGIGIGAALLPVAATLLMAQGDWRTALIGVALFSLVLTLPANLLWLKERPQAASARVQAGAPGGLAFRDVLRSPSFMVLAAAFFLLGVVNGGLVTNQIPLLTDAGVSPQRAAAVQSVFGLAVLVGRFVAGVLLDHMPGQRLMAIVCAGGMLACGLYAMGVTNEWVFLCAVLVGAIFGAEFDVLAYLIKRYFGVAAFGRSYGAVFAVFQLGSSLGIALLPLSRARLGSYAPGLVAGVLLLGVCALLFLWLGSLSRAAAPAAVRPAVPAASVTG
jgi:predicted MFS family arabinose efflux permease